MESSLSSLFLPACQTHTTYRKNQNGAMGRDESEIVMLKTGFQGDLENSVPFSSSQLLVKTDTDVE